MVIRKFKVSLYTASNIVKHVIKFRKWANSQNFQKYNVSVYLRFYGSLTGKFNILIQLRILSNIRLTSSASLNIRFYSNTSTTYVVLHKHKHNVFIIGWIL